MLKRMSHCAAAAAVLACGLSAHASVIYSADFESPTYTLNSAIAGQAGWTASSGNDLVRGSSYGGGWASNGQYLVVNGDNDIAKSPAFTSNGQTTTTISYDVRPGDSATSVGQSAGTQYIMDNAVTTRMMFSMYFRSDGSGGSKGTIWAANGATYTDTNIPWQFVDHNTLYHIDVTLDSTAKTWSLSVNNGSAVTGSFSAVFGFSASTSGEPGSAWLRGGKNNNPGGLVAYDNLTVTAVPEPAAGLLIMGGLLPMLRRRRR
ncbi:MAG: hypothetical protein IT447_12100 [Phycisphaerales bacterium]|jgi:hypothetical protein|nr:hypothetical protein [Phycisphaerales bacterium]